MARCDTMIPRASVEESLSPRARRGGEHGGPAARAHSTRKKARSRYMSNGLLVLAEQIAARHLHAMCPSRVREIARRHGLPVIDLMPDFEAAFTGFGSLFIEWDGHPNGRAYGVAARRIRESVAGHGGVDAARAAGVSR